MATSDVEIFNLALGACGSSDTVAATTEVSRAAEACNKWYSHVKEIIFAAAFWPSNTAYARLAVAAERDTAADWVPGDPAPGWLYAYSYPNQMVRPRYMVDFSRFELGTINNSTNTIMSNTPEALLCYTIGGIGVQQWGPGLTDAIIFGLAAHIVTEITGKNARIRQLLEQANMHINEGRAIHSNSQENQLESLPEWLQVRGFNGAPVSRYIYPYGPSLTLLGGTGVG